MLQTDNTFIEGLNISLQTFTPYSLFLCNPYGGKILKKFDFCLYPSFKNKFQASSSKNGNTSIPLFIIPLKGKGVKTLF